LLLLGPILAGSIEKGVPASIETVVTTLKEVRFEKVEILVKLPLQRVPLPLLPNGVPVLILLREALLLLRDFPIMIEAATIVPTLEPRIEVPAGAAVVIDTIILDITKRILPRSTSGRVQVLNAVPFSTI
jgi:hypothetical protein